MPRLVKTLLTEFITSTLILLCVVGGLLGLMSFAELEVESGLTPWWAYSAAGQPLTAVFIERAPLTLGLSLGALFVSIFLSLLTLVFAQPEYKRSKLFWLGSAASGVPTFCVGYFFISQSPPLFFAILTLGFADWNYGAVSNRLCSLYHRKINSPAFLAVRSRGGSVLRHLWPHLSLTLIHSARDRLPIMLASSVVVERIFNLPGLGDEAIRAVLDLPDPVFLVWFTLFIVVCNRLLFIATAVMTTLLSRPSNHAHNTARFTLFGASNQSKSVASESTKTLSGLAADWLPERENARFSTIKQPEIIKSRQKSPHNSLLWIKRISMIFLVLTGIALLCSFFFDEQTETIHKLPSWSSVLGTDGLGRDVFLQIGLGARNSMLYWVLAVSLPLVCGSLMAFLAVMTRFKAITDFIAALIDCLPKLVLILLLVSIVGVEKYLHIALPVAGLLFLNEVYYDLSRRMLWLIEHRFVEAEFTLGLSAWRVFVSHLIMTHARPILANKAVVIFAAVLILDTSCGYLEIAQRDLYAWGALVSDNAREWSRLAGTDLPFNPAAFWAPLFVIIACITYARTVSESLRDREAWLLGEKGA